MKKYFHIGLAVLSLIFGTQQVSAQDGAALFKSKCNTCHMIDKNSTGPALKGAKKRWEDAGEGDLIYDWVHNSATLIASGKSKRAAEVKTFSPTDMPPQTVTNEEIDAILNYVDTYTEPTGPVKDSTTATAGVTGTAEVDYEGNLTLFYWLSAGIIILLIAIIIMSTSITTLVKSDFFKRKLQENNKDNSGIITTVLALVGVFGLITAGSNTFALTFMSPGEAEEATPWLKVETGDLYFMVAINIILLGVLFYLRKMFKDFMLMARPKTEEKAPETAIKKINNILTDAVAIEDEEKILMHHEYDGIKELDNNLPPWWVWGFYGTIVFAVVYILNYHVFRTADLQIVAYDKEMTQSKKDIDAYLSKMAMNVDETNATQLTDPAAIAAGKATFEANCVACHNPNAEGNIGPNLTDDFWIYGPDIKDLFKTIKNGTPNGMPEHASKLNPVQIQQVASFVLSLPYTKGKDPQGTEYPGFKENQGKEKK